MDSSIRRCRECGGEFFAAADGFPGACPHCGSREIAWFGVSRPGEPDFTADEFFLGALGGFQDLYP